MALATVPTLTQYVNRLLIQLIMMYQALRRPFPPVCRFYPSCSVYAVEALSRFCLLHALGLIIKRLLRCHPWHPGGLDPLPDRDNPAAAVTKRNN